MDPSAGDKPKHWSVEARDSAYKCRIFEVMRYRCHHPGRDSRADFYVIETRDWVQCLARTVEGDLVLVNQYRFGRDQLSWEVPGGVVDPGEDPARAAVRELEEETGYTGKPPVLIGTCSANPAILNNRCHFYFVDQARLTHPRRLDEHEEIQVRTVPLQEVFRWATNGTIHHVIAQSALFHLQAHLSTQQ